MKDKKKDLEQLLRDIHLMMHLIPDTKTCSNRTSA